MNTLHEDFGKSKSSLNNASKTTHTETNSLLKDEINQIDSIDVEKDVIINKDQQLYKYDERNRIGNMFVFWYRNGEPRIVIGPHCKEMF
jgi:hypothetical protein